MGTHAAHTEAGSAPPVPPSGGGAAAWLRTLGGALVVALLLRALFFEAYRIPSTSMEDTLLVGDFLLVSKLHVGARLFGHRLPALGAVERGDVVVFNYPPGLEPRVADRMPYIKRLVGMPGDTLALARKRLVVNRDTLGEPPEARRYWAARLEAEGRAAAAIIESALRLPEPLHPLGPRTWLLNATAATADTLAHLPGVVSVEPFVRDPADGSAAFPQALGFSLDDYGPVVVPRRGLTVRLDDETWPLYRVAIERDEGYAVERTAEGFLVGGVPSETYTFTQDYYFALGDNRDDSADSRTWGFVPASHLIGKAVVLYFSWDDAAQSVRWDRVLRRVERSP
jgi:signal peptidase I